MIEKTKRSIQWVKKINKQKYAGIHLIAEFWNGKIIEDTKEIKKILAEAVKKAKNAPLEIVIHKFSPQGLTGVVLLEESHIAIHTWPEINYVAIDIFTCGEKAIPRRALEYLKKTFKPKKIEIKELKRGKLE
ncbi:MAG: adenosylmethionine decarboxylase [Candidatus Nealsonbacteria bacterium CG02_land_8_20_14_3_00_37_10]|uniref:S-adenosylmethionine decarboxylase proenzyme n=2 Tax=Candidatus Nealsoniibacteriota TaxID=1817911 RepID=A0A2G9YY40_9BACT|nr:MAG: adenosylmethionine decarboxylase [Candidatus Nealsonbacteria bacterium CG23_combo_of_CG06-09_8_20_14_all_37_18]PIV44893.1 MAG: adenosylmethionine decarboxylase [Candidatus Nealsonbacteria bacterium CG02_land_8_20_14_3_00_37_10]